MMVRNHFSRIVALLLVGSVFFARCSSIVPQPTPTAEPEPVEEFNPVASATGIVVPSQYATLSTQASGVIEEVLVSEDEQVSAGQVLIRLEGEESMQAAIMVARSELLAAQQAFEDLYEDHDVRVAAAAQAVVEAEQEVEDAQRDVNNLGRSTEADIDQARANMVLAKDKLDKAREDYEPYANKPEDNLVRAAYLSKLAQAEKDYDAAVRLLNNLTAEARPLDVAEAEANLALAQANLEKAKDDYEMLKAGPDPDDVALAKARLATAEDQLAAAEAALEDLELRAPFDGTVSELYIRTNEWVAPGQQVLLLADLSDLRVETTDLNEIDVAQLEPGDPATVTFDALPDMVVEGSVARIASKAAQGAGVNYTVVVELQEIPAALRWGMTAFVDIAFSD